MKFVSRAEWGARPPNGSYSSINSQMTTGHWEGPHMGTFDHSSCASKVRGIQAYHMDGNGWTDIAYNGMVCPHGYVFEGRGPGIRSAANGTNQANDTSVALCYLGGEGDPFTAEGQQGMADGASWLNSPLQKGHRDWFNTSCPGDEIYNWIYSGVIPAPGPVAPGGPAPPFPYPADNYLGQESPDPRCHSGYYEGDRPNIAQWQDRMSGRGWPIMVDGFYGPQSESVCGSFQREKGLTDDGLVGPVTWENSWTAPIT